MTSEELEQLKFPIGTYAIPETISVETIAQWINEIELFPSRIIQLTSHLSTEQLNWQYRPNGWSIKQVVHHCVDSHMNSIIRFKLALTEDNPTIRPYFEDRWAKLDVYKEDDLSDSIQLLKALHSKLGKLLRSISKEEMSRTFQHPEYGNQYRIDETIGNYAWHGNHHAAHIEQALKHKGTFN